VSASSCTSKSNAFSHWSNSAVTSRPARHDGSDIHHRTEDFRNLYKQVLSDLGHVLGTSNDVLVLVASGSGGLEAATQNFFSPGDEVLCARRKVRRALGGNHEGLGHEGDCPYRSLWRRRDAGGGRAGVGENGNFKGVFVQASETSTGAQHDVKAMARRQENESYFCGRRYYGHRHHAARYRGLGLDVVIGGSQKAS